jgi:hypothetical protein
MTPTFPESVVDEHRHPRGGPEARANTPDSAGLAISKGGARKEAPPDWPAFVAYLSSVTRRLRRLILAMHCR